MSTAALWKIPFIIVGSACLQVSMTPPNPHAKSKSIERARYEREHGTSDMLPMPFAWGPPTFRAIGHAINLLEIVAIIASAYPSAIKHSSLGPFAESFDVALYGEHIYISTAFAVGTFLAVFGSYIRASCYRHLGRLFTFELTIQNDHKLVTSGPYSIVRHPSYLGLFAFYLGSAFSQFGPGSFWDAAGLWGSPVGRLFGVYYIGYRLYVGPVLFVRAAKEDEVLRKEFRDEWVSWAQKTRYKLIPFVY